MNVLDDFLVSVCRALDVDPTSVDRDLILDLTKTVAHEVARPAAPLAAFVVGLAAGRAGGGPEEVRNAAAAVAALVIGERRRAAEDAADQH